MVSGSRQTNSTARRSAGTRSWTQTMVGTSRTSISSTVSAASSSDSVMASTRSGSLPIASQESSVRSPPTPRVENSSMAKSGSSR